MSRYDHIKQVHGEDLFQAIYKSKLLVVGAGGIGCELLKDLVLSGFINVEIIDLDTIDVSNLNRQFLFRQEHVGKSKAVIAKETAFRFNSESKIVAHHGSIFAPEFGLDYFRQFDVVLNALDNVDARKHVNRMCLATGTVMIDGGTAGYRGTVISYQKGITKCYECDTKLTAKSYAICTIRTNPSTPIHCIVWAKLLFERLFGKIDESNSISDFEVLFNEAHKTGEEFAAKVFDKVYVQDIIKLTDLTQQESNGEAPNKQIWNSGKAPEPIDRTNATSEAVDTAQLEEQRVWNLSENIQHFIKNCSLLHERKINDQKEDPNLYLTFDKDDEQALHFVTAAANLRCFNFHISPRKSVFDAKAIAGNIVPAIATSNAIISGVMVQELIKIVNRKMKGEENLVADCRTIAGYLQEMPSLRPNRKIYVNVEQTDKPSSKCFVCSSNYISVTLNTRSTTLNYFVNEVLLKKLGLREPMVYLGSNLIYEHSEDDDDDDFAATFKANLDKSLDTLKVVNEVVLSVSDNQIDVEWSILIAHNGGLDNDEFEIKGDTEKVTEHKIVQEEMVTGDDDDDLISWTSEDLKKQEEIRAKRGLKRKRESEEETPDKKRVKANDGKRALTDVVEID